MGHLSSTFNMSGTLLGVLSQSTACYSLINPEEVGIIIIPILKMEN